MAMHAATVSVSKSMLRRKTFGDRQISRESGTHIRFLISTHLVPGAADTGWVGEDGQVRRPWCAATRVLEHREAERLARAAERSRKESQQHLYQKADAKPSRRQGFPEIKAIFRSPEIPHLADVLH
jgi:hypothetical protein